MQLLPKSFLRNGPATRVHLAAALALFTWLVLAACLETPAARLTYFGTVVRVEEPEGIFFSPAIGRGGKPLKLIHLQLRDRNASAGGVALTIAVLYAYEPSRFGKAGDSVAFEYDGIAPSSGELAYEDLLNYRVVCRGGKPTG